MAERSGVPTKQDKLQSLRQSVTDVKSYFATKNTWVSRDGFVGITPDELLDLGTHLLDCSTISQAYDLLAQKPKSGDGNFYDRLIAEPQHLEAYKGFDRVIQWRETNRVERAIDFATGSGTMALIMGQVADSVVASDISGGLLKVAHNKLAKASFIHQFNVVQASALDYIPPHNQRFDIAASNAFTHYLTYEEQVTFYRNLKRVLKPGGRYYEPQQEKSGEEVRSYYASPMGYLAEQIADIVLSLRNPHWSRKVVNPEQLGFTINCYAYSEVPFIRQVMQIVNT